MRTDPQAIGRLQAVFGKAVLLSPDLPRMTLSEDCPVSPDVRSSVNDWMRGFFGTSNLIRDGQVIATAQALHMNPRTFAQLKAAL